MAGIIGIYGLVVSVLISNDLKQGSSLFTNFIQLGAGLSVGLAGMAAGFAIGIVGDAGVRGTAQQPRLFVGMILILIFAEVLGAYNPKKWISCITDWTVRSLRSHCCPAHELSWCRGCVLLSMWTHFARLQRTSNLLRSTTQASNHLDTFWHDLLHSHGVHVRHVVCLNLCIFFGFLKHRKLGAVEDDKGRSKA